MPSSNPDSPHQSCDRCSFDSDGEYWQRLREVSNFDERQTREQNSRAKYTRETRRTREARGVLKLLSASLVLAQISPALLFFLYFQSKSYLVVIFILQHNVCPDKCSYFFSESEDESTTDTRDVSEKELQQLERLLLSLEPSLYPSKGGYFDDSSEVQSSLGL